MPATASHARVFNIACCEHLGQPFVQAPTGLEAIENLAVACRVGAAPLNDVRAVSAVFACCMRKLLAVVERILEPFTQCCRFCSVESMCRVPDREKQCSVVSAGDSVDAVGEFLDQEGGYSAAYPIVRLPGV